MTANVVNIGNVVKYRDMFGHMTTGTVVHGGVGWCWVRGELGATEQRRPDELEVI
jgi:hypothetical protein